MPKYTLDQLEFMRRGITEQMQILEDCGVIVTVERRPMEPLAMGNHECVVTVREARDAMFTAQDNALSTWGQLRLTPEWRN